MMMGAIMIASAKVLERDSSRYLLLLPKNTANQISNSEFTNATFRLPAKKRCKPNIPHLMVFQLMGNYND